MIETDFIAAAFILGASAGFAFFCFLFGSIRLGCAVGRSLTRTPGGSICSGGFHG